MTTSLYESFGALELPPDVLDMTGLDPARATLAALFSTAINAELAGPWGQATGTLPSTHPLRGTMPVQDVLELEPSPQVMQQRRAGWPLLCLHRTGAGVLEQHTINGQVERLTQPWDLHYILGPLDVAQMRQLADICIAAVKVVRLCIRRRGHPAYLGGALQFFPTVTGTAPDQVVPLFPSASYLGSVELKSYDGPGQAAYAGDEKNVLYYAVTMHLETVEYTTDQDLETDVVAEADISVALQNDDDNPIDDFVQGQTDPDEDYQYP